VSRSLTALLALVEKAIIHSTLRDRAKRIDPLVRKTKPQLAEAFQKQKQLFLTERGWKFTEANAEDVATSAEGWLDDWDAVTAKTSGLFLPPLTTLAEGGLEAGFTDRMETMSVGIAFDLANPRAVAYVQEHGADLGTKIDEATRDRMKTVIENAIENGDSYGSLAKDLEAMFDECSEFRSELIAVTEAAFGYGNGNLQGGLAAKEAGLVVQKRWVLADTHEADDECDENADAGWIDIEDSFPSGDDCEPAHPNCWCYTEQRVVTESDEEGDGNGEGD